MIRNSQRLVRRNETCPFCASGKKFKKCCGAPRPIAVEGVPCAAGHSHEQPARLEGLTLFRRLSYRPAVLV